ncbi:MAG: tetratricopeptide repeat protein [Terriglobales bacterium]
MSLHTPGRRLGFFALVLLLVSFYVGSCAKVFYASHLGLSERTSDLKHAVQLQPRNARYHFLLANNEFVVESDPVATVRELKVATGLDPHTSGYWLALARAELVEGDLAGQQNAIEQALRVDPTTPDVAWEAANFYVVRGELHPALRCLRTVIENDPEAAPRAVALAWRASGSAATAMAEALPAQTEAYGALLHQAMLANDRVAADLVWAHAYALRQAIPVMIANEYIGWLLDSKRVTEARQVWRQLLERDEILKGYGTGDDLVVNGGFEKELLNGGFDWRIQPTPSVKVDLDNVHFHEGHQALAVAFDANYVANIGVVQPIPVQPDTMYAFRAFVRSEDLESAIGPKFVVDDAFSHARLGMSQEISGSGPWDERAFDFKTGPQTSLVVISVVRDPSNTLIRGKLWIDDVSITRKKTN